MRKVTPKANDDGTIVGYVFHCPGCECGHIYYTATSWPDGVTRPAWEFNGVGRRSLLHKEPLEFEEAHPTQRSYK